MGHQAMPFDLAVQIELTILISRSLHRAHVWNDTNPKFWLHLDKCSLIARISPYLCPITVTIIWRIVSNFTGGHEPFTSGTWGGNNSLVELKSGHLP